MISEEEIWKKGYEKVINEIEEMRREVRGEMEKMKEEIEKLYERLNEERRAREEDKKKDKKEVEKERKKLEDRIASVEWTQERKEQEARKNIIVIKGVKWGRERLEQEVEEFINEKLKVEVKVRKTSAISLGRDVTIVVAEIESWERNRKEQKQKRNIMLNKKVLEKGVFIEDDLTRKERETTEDQGNSQKREREREWK